MASLTEILIPNGTKTAPAPAAAALASSPAVPSTPANGTSHPAPRPALGAAAADLVARTAELSFRAKLHGQIFGWKLTSLDGTDPAHIVEGLKEIDPACELDSSFGKGGGYGGKKADKRAVVQMMLIDKFSTRIIATTPEGATITASWSSKEKDKLAEALSKLPLADVEKAQAAQALEGQISVGTLALAGRGVEVGYYENEWQGKKELRATELVHAAAPVNGNGTNGNGGAA